MKKKRNCKRIPLTIALLTLAFPAISYAYLDPGTGSYFFQLLIGLLLGGLFAVKLWWSKIKSFFVRVLSKLKK